MRAPGTTDKELRGRLLRGGSWAFGGKIFAALMQLVTAALAARLLAPSALGAYFIVTTLVLLLSIAARLGADRIVVRLVSEARGTGRLEQARDAVRVSVKLGVIGALAIGALSYPLVRVLGERVFHSRDLVDESPMIAAWVAVTGMQLLLAECFRGFEQIGAATFYGSMVPTGLIALSFTAAWLLSGSVSSFRSVLLLSVIGTAVPGLLSAVALFRHVRTLPTSAVPGHSMRSVLVPSIPMLLNQMFAYALSNIGLWVVGAVLLDRDAAVYGVALRMVQVVTMTLFVVNQVIPPFVAQLNAAGEKQRLQNMVRITAAASAAPTIVVILAYVLVGGPLLGLLFGRHYAEGAPILAVLALGQLGTMIVGSCAMVLSMTGEERILMTSTALTTFLSLVTSFVGARYFGSMGVAVAIGTLATVQQLTLCFVCRARIGVWTHADFPALFRQGPKLWRDLQARRARASGAGT